MYTFLCISQHGALHIESLYVVIDPDRLQWHIASLDAVVDNVTMHIENEPTIIPHPTLNIDTSVDAVAACISRRDAARTVAPPYSVYATPF